MKKEIICIVSPFFRAFSQFYGIFPSERAKTYSSTARTLLKIASGKRAALGHFVPSGRALFSSRIFQLCANYYIVSRLLIEMNLDGTFLHLLYLFVPFCTIPKKARSSRSKHSQIRSSRSKHRFFFGLVD